ncbi:sugar ABC transporter ATP-binding protein [Schaalia sp. ZJ405]|uniref:sugar ABC transporter ATP-binding protein n=1 Tax=unclassified Schaalia TaxID=2691889 RepID=UPI0013EB3EFC|nr:MULTISPECIES: sugar ABC transporter ATP-binding protein [unclassified Schaalia]QPK81605.1 sugar ABC transporter ATP-binding protein [Schaalia sp. ZJ405]
MTNLLELKGISKTFPGVKALSDVDLDLRAGEILGLCGENGAGKSTLMKVLTGIHKADPGGEIWLQGEKVEIRGTNHARDLGLSIIHQELNIIPDLTVAQNLYIGRPRSHRGGYISDRQLVKDARELFERLNMELNPNDVCRDLPVARLQMLEIARALSYESTKILVMDEPTAPLTTTETDQLFELVHNFITPQTGLIFITHRMPELARMTDRIAVLRDGQYIGTVDTATTPMPEVIKMMVGRAVPADARPTTKPISDEVLLKVEGLSTKKTVHDVSFEVKKGEIFGFAGLVGAGRTEVARALSGADPHTEGEIFINGQKVKIRNATDGVKNGIGYLSEDRKQYGLLLDKSIAFNTALASMDQFNKAAVITSGKIEKVAQEYVDKLRTRCPGIDTEVRALSGGNQQKVVIAKWLVRDAEILIFDEPTRGIDVGAKDEIYTLLEELARQGKAIIVISSELPEVLRLANRVAVMAHGRIIGTLNNEDATQESIMELATVGQEEVNGEVA